MQKIGPGFRKKGQTKKIMAYNKQIEKTYNSGANGFKG